jgi:hypothetical protein
LFRFSVALFASRGSGPEGGQGGGYLFRPDRLRWITWIADQPLEFYAYPLRRAGLEGDPVNLRLGVCFREVRRLDHDFNPTRWV